MVPLQPAAQDSALAAPVTSPKLSDTASQQGQTAITPTTPGAAAGGDQSSVQPMDTDSNVSATTAAASKTAADADEASSKTPPPPFIPGLDFVNTGSNPTTNDATNTTEQGEKEKEEKDDDKKEGEDGEQGKGDHRSPPGLDMADDHARDVEYDDSKDSKDAISEQDKEKLAAAAVAKATEAAAGPDEVCTLFWLCFQIWKWCLKMFF